MTAFVITVLYYIFMNEDLKEINTGIGRWKSFDNESDALKELRLLSGDSLDSNKLVEYKCYEKDGVLNTKTFEKKSYCICAKYSVVDKLKVGKFYIYSNNIEMRTICTSKIPPSYTPIEALSLEFGYGLVPLIDEESGSELVERIETIRNEIVLTLGLPVPQIKITSNMSIEPSDYIIKVFGNIVGKGKIYLGQYLAINPGGDRKELSGTNTTDPTFNLPAKWIDEDVREFAEREGYTVVDTPSIILTHLAEVIKNNAYKLLGIDEVNIILNSLKKEYPVLLKEVMTIYTIGEIQKEFKSLLKDKKSIRDIVHILEKLCDSSIKLKKNSS